MYAEPALLIERGWGGFTPEVEGVDAAQPFAADVFPEGAAGA